MRAGALADSDMLGRHGMPTTSEALEDHQMIGFVSSRTGHLLPLEFTRGNEVIEVTLPTRLSVSSVETSAAAAQKGFRLVQAPRYRFINDLEKGQAD
ncbi:LysR family transcriptional regulator [Gluconobacter japonicus]|nr:LysR family transcriptional regulator [Gluconobacter japonicus]